MRTLIKLTSQCDLTSIARQMYPRDVQISIYRTWVEYNDDPTTQRLFNVRAAAHNPFDTTWGAGNNPHSLAPLANRDFEPDTHLIIDGVHLLTSNIMLRTNSDEGTLTVATDMLTDELAVLKTLPRDDISITILSADIHADHSLTTFQGLTYQKLLSLTNTLTIEFFKPDHIYTALSAGLIQEL